MPTFLTLVLSCFLKLSVFLVCTVAKISHIVDGVLRRVMRYVVDTHLIWASNRHQEMIGYKAVNTYRSLVWHNLLPNGRVFYTSILSPNTTHIAKSYSRPAIAVV